MTTPVYTSPFTGTVVTPTDVSYYALSFSSNTELFWPSTVNASQVPAARIIDCVASSSGLTILLPAANQGTVGSDILFRNLGAFSFFITDAAGGQSISVPAGISKYVYLSDNTSIGGTWQNVTFAAGTSYADAATLAGLGLTAISGKLATTQNPVDVTSSPTIADASRAATYVWGAGAGTFTMPSTSTLSTGWYIGFRNNGTGALLIQPSGTDLINGQPSITANPGDSGFIILDTIAGGFVTIGLAPANNVTFTSATYDVDTIVGNTLSLVSFAPIIQTYVAQSGTRTQTLAVTLPAITQIYILVNDTNQPSYDVTFQVQGSSQPPLAIGSGGVATVLSDGTNLYSLTSSSTGTFYAADGSAALPSYTFNNDVTTGTYLAGTSVLGLSANGVQIASFDGSNLLDPQVNITAQLNATLIAGGTFS